MLTTRLALIILFLFAHYSILLFLLNDLLLFHYVPIIPMCGGQRLSENIQHILHVAKLCIIIHNVHACTWLTCSTLVAGAWTNVCLSAKASSSHCTDCSWRVRYCWNLVHHPVKSPYFLYFKVYFRIFYPCLVLITWSVANEIVQIWSRDSTLNNLEHT